MSCCMGEEHQSTLCLLPGADDISQRLFCHSFALKIIICCGDASIGKLVIEPMLCTVGC